MGCFRVDDVQHEVTIAPLRCKYGCPLVLARGQQFLLVDTGVVLNIIDCEVRAERDAKQLLLRVEAHVKIQFRVDILVDNLNGLPISIPNW